MTTFSIESGPLQSALEDAYKRLDRTCFADALWRKQLDVWSADPSVQSLIATRLGWLEALDVVTPQLPRLRAFAEAVRKDGFTHVVLLGMGGSSLAPEVLRQILASQNSDPSFHVLDSVDPDAVRAAMAHAATSLFIVASKSGSTIEPTTMAAEAKRRVIEAGHSQWASRFVAITDEGTVLHRSAIADGYRDVFVNPSNIGGRYSALSLFGMVPAALMGLDLDRLLAGARVMESSCRLPNALENPGLALGALMGAGFERGRDKMSLLVPERLESFGLWVEQLVAESTGKHGKGALPVVDEPLGRPDEYGSDRAFVAISTDRDAPDEDRLAALEAAGHPVLRLSTRIDGLGAEFFRWEFATAVAGAALGINPFDEPNVSEAKEKTKALLTAFASTGSLPTGTPIASADGIDAFSPTITGKSPAGVVRAALDSLRPRDYVAFLSYLPAASDVEVKIGEIREGIRTKHHVASTFGVGPRYLHSTGQYHKGGPNTVLAFVVTNDDETQTEIPGAGYTFSTLKQAQALGDAETLAAHGRRVVRLHLNSGTTVSGLETVFADALR